MTHHLTVAHHKSPINEYDYLAINTGAREPPPVYIYDGRLCYVSDHVRTRAKKGWSFYNAVVVRFLDDGSAVSMGMAQFDRKAKAAPLDLTGLTAPFDPLADVPAAGSI